MNQQPSFVVRVPSVDEFEDLNASVDFKPRDRKAIAIALANTYYGVCAESDGAIV